MKKLLFSFLAVISYGTFFAQGPAHEGFSDVAKYTKNDIPAEFETRFKNDDDKESFKRLREFLQEKEDVLDALQTEKKRYRDPKDEIRDYTRKITDLTRIIDKKKDKDKVVVPTELMGDYNPNGTILSGVAGGEYMVMDIKERIETFNMRISDLRQTTYILSQLDKNIANVQQDIYSCRSQIDSALAPEYKQQRFRQNISLYFTILIGILLFIFFFIVYRRSDKGLSRELLSGNGLQFVTLFVLIIAIILFGILNILQGSELAAILSGISGYILGKGTKANTEENTTPPPNVVVVPPAQNPPATETPVTPPAE
jgi:hypothetical protein